MKFFSSNLKVLRNLSRLTQAEIKDRLGIEPTAWSNYERGKSYPKLELFYQISKFFEVSEADLLNLDLREGEVLTKIFGNKKGEVLGEVEGEVSTNIRKSIKIQNMISKNERISAEVRKQLPLIYKKPNRESLYEEVQKLWSKISEMDEKLNDDVNSNKNSES